MAQSTQIIEVEDEEDESGQTSSNVILTKQDENVNIYDKFLIIEGLPQPLFSDLREVICNIGRFYDVKLTHNDIVCAYHVSPKNNAGGGGIVLTKFSNELMYGLLMGRHFSSKKKLVSSSIGLTGNFVISMSHNLTPSNRNLIKMANQLFTSKDKRTKKKKHRKTRKKPSESGVQKPLEESNIILIEDSTNSESDKFKIESVYSLQNGENPFKQTVDHGFIIEELYSSPDDSLTESDAEDRENESSVGTDGGTKVLTYKELLKTVYNRELRVIVKRLDMDSLNNLTKMDNNNKKLPMNNPPLLLKRKKSSPNKEDISVGDVPSPKRSNSARKGRRKSKLTKRSVSDEDFNYESDKLSSVTLSPVKRERRTSVLPKKLEEFVCRSVVKKSYSPRSDSDSNKKRRKTDNNYDALYDEDSSNEEEPSSSEEEWVEELIIQYPKGKGRPPVIRYPTRRGRPPKASTNRLKGKRKLEKKITPNPPDILEDLEIDTKVTSIKTEPLSPSDEKSMSEIQTQTETNFTKPNVINQLLNSTNFCVKTETIPQLITSSNQLIEHLRVQKLFDSNVEHFLLRNFSGVPWKVILKPKDPQNKFNSFTSHQNHLAMSLFLFAPKAFKFLGGVFCLPDEVSLGKMTESRNGEPGFLTEVMDDIKENFCLKGRKDFCLLVDRVPLKRGVLWDPGEEKFSGYTEVCPWVRRDDALAAEALVVFASALNSRYKAPIAYFLLDSTCPGMMAKVIDLAIDKMHRRKAKVWSVTLDASDDSLECVRQLGCNFDMESGETTSHFAHHGSGSDIHVFIDTHHLLKIARNVLAEKEVILSPRGSIDWHYIKTIKKFISESPGGLNENNPNMYLNLSDSVAVALDSLRNQKVAEFLGSEPTSEFIKILNMVHRIANSSNPLSHGHSKPIFEFNIDSRISHLKESRNFLTDIIIDGVPIAKHNRRLFVKGFVLTIHSIIFVSQQVIKRLKTLKYICTNVFSLDHIDSFYSEMIFQTDSKGPLNTSDFKMGIKNFMRRNLDPYSTYFNYYPSVVDFRSEKRSFNCVRSPSEHEKDVFNYVECLVKLNLRIYANDILNCIGNLIVVHLVNKLSCPYCVFMLQKDHENLTVDKHDYAAASSIKDFKNLYKRRGVCNSSLSFYRVLKICDGFYRFCKITESLTNLKEFTTKVIHLTKDHIIRSCFYPFIEYNHPISQDLLAPIHEYQLVDLICKEYVNIRVSSLKFSFSNFF